MSSRSVRSSPCTQLRKKEEGRDGDGFQVPGLGDEWKMGCPKGPMWESEGEAWSEDEDVSSGGSHEGNMFYEALHVGDKISLFL